MLNRAFAARSAALRPGIFRQLSTLLASLVAIVVGVPAVAQAAVQSAAVAATGVAVSAKVVQATHPSATVSTSVGVPFHLAACLPISAPGNVARHAWHVTGLPTGLRFSVPARSKCPAISGTPSKAGTWHVTVQVAGPGGSGKSASSLATMSWHETITVKAVSTPTKATRTPSKATPITPTAKPTSAKTTPTPAPPFVTLNPSTQAVTFNPTVDLVPSGYTLSGYGDMGPGAVGDCVESAAASYEQLLEHSSQPLDPSGYLAEYDKLVAAEGEAPGPESGTLPQALFADWETGGVAGTHIAGVTTVGTDQASIEAALHSGPLFMTLEMPAPSAVTIPWEVNAQGFLATPWTTASDTPSYTGSSNGGAFSHAVLAVGFDSSYVYVVTWGLVLPISWSLFASLVTAAWSIQP